MVRFRIRTPSRRADLDGGEPFREQPEDAQGSRWERLVSAVSRPRFEGPGGRQLVQHVVDEIPRGRTVSTAATRNGLGEPSVGGLDASNDGARVRPTWTDRVEYVRSIDFTDEHDDPGGRARTEPDPDSVPRRRSGRRNDEPHVGVEGPSPGPVDQVATPPARARSESGELSPTPCSRDGIGARTTTG